MLLGFRKGFVEYTRFDVVCQAAAIAGIILWQLFNSPTIGVLASVTLDFIGALPTLKHSWIKPHEETWPTYALSGVGGLWHWRHFRITILLAFHMLFTSL